MIAEFEDFCLWMYVIVDELWGQLPAAYKRGSGPAPACSDSELLTLALVGECRGWTTETTLLSQWAEYAALFPVLPERSRFNRRRRGLQHALNAIRRAVLAVLDVAQDGQCAIDSLPVPVLAFHLVPSAAGADGWRAEGADFGKVPTKKQTIFGYKLHLLVTLGGVIRDFALAPASASDVAVGAGLLHEQAGLTVVGDKAYIGASLAAELRAERGRPADRPAPQSVAAAPAGGGPPAQRRTPDHRDRQRSTERAVRPRPPSCPHLPRPLRPALHQADRAHPLHLSESAPREPRLPAAQSPRLPELAHGPSRNNPHSPRRSCTLTTFGLY